MQPGTVVAGKYRVERVIGRGGMGLVAEAVHLALQTRVAIKFLDASMVAEPVALARFTREARATAQLKSEHICRVTDFGVDGKVPYIVMELLVGTDLARLAKLRTLDPPTAALYVRQACAGLEEAHRAQIIHRDLKPGNLFVTRRDNGAALIKILDFGVAKAPAEISGEAITGTSNVVGSAGFMSPEQFRSSRSVDARADIWSLGVILYKLVSSRLPFAGDGFAEFALSITRQQMQPLPEAPAEFTAVVARCLEKDPARRFSDVTALAEALAPFAALARSSAPVIPTASTADPPSADSAIETRISGAHSAVARATPPHGRPVATPARGGGQGLEVRGSRPGAAGKTILGTHGPQDTARTTPNPVPAAVVTPQQVTAAGTAVGSAPAPRYPSGELAPGTVVGEYRIERKIGQGGMGTVYGAVHPVIGKKAAIKVISPEVGAEPAFVQRFVHEAWSVNQIGHPNIVDVFAFGNLPDGRSYFVMELLEGESLRERLRRSFVQVPEGLQILDEIAAALEAAHEKQIVHRDLKPDNVFLAKVRGHIIVKLLDFGIAKLSVHDGVAKTSTGEMMGTPGYLSPEQARGRNVDYRTDIYALGCMMYEIVTGRIPFIAESPMDVVLMHISTPPRRPSELAPGLPPALDRIIVEMLDKSPDLRPSLNDVRNVFAELVASGMVDLESQNGSSFRSELAQGKRGGAERAGPSGEQVAADARAASAAMARHRTPAPTDAPTRLASRQDAVSAPQDDGLDVPARSSRRGLVLALAGLAVVATGVAAFATLSGHDGGTATRDATIAHTSAPPAVAVDAMTATPVAVQVADASVTAPPPVVPDANTTRDVHVHVDVATARIEIDGAVVPASNGAATIPLPDGSHRISITAAGRVPYTAALEVSAAMTPLEIKLQRVHKAPVKSGHHPAHTPTGDETIDPF